MMISPDSGLNNLYKVEAQAPIGCRRKKRKRGKREREEEKRRKKKGKKKKKEQKQKGTRAHEMRI